MATASYSDLPPLVEAERVLSGVRHLSFRDETGKLVLWVGFRGSDDVQLAIACHPSIKGRWASRTLLQSVLREAFSFGAERVWVYTDRVPMALTAGLERGYNSGTPSGLTYMEMTKEEYERKYEMRG